MVQDGRTTWDEPIVDPVPDFRLSDPDLTASVTFRDILSHRTGLGEKESLWTSGDYTSEQIYHHLDEMQAVAPPPSGDCPPWDVTHGVLDCRAAC